MTRALTSGMVTELAAATIRPLFLFEGVFASSTLRLWTGSNDLSWDSQTWLGNGWFSGIPRIPTDNDIRPNNIDIALSGVPSSLVSLILSESQHSSRGRVWIGMFDSSNDIIDDPFLLFDGALSSPRIDDSSDISEIVLTYEDDLIVLQRSSDLRYNHNSQQALFPGDLGFQFDLSDWTGFWGKKHKKKESKDSKKGKRKKDKSDRR